MKSSSFRLKELLPRSNEFIFGFLCDDDFSYRLSLSKNDLLRLLFEISSSLIFGQFDRNYATPSAFSSLRVPLERFTPLILLLFASRVRSILMCVCSIVQFDKSNSCKVELYRKELKKSLMHSSRIALFRKVSLSKVLLYPTYLLILRQLKQSKETLLRTSPFIDGIKLNVSQSSSMSISQYSMPLTFNSESV